MGLQWILKLNSQSCEITLEPTKDNGFCSLEQKWSMDEPWAIHTHKTHHGQKGQHFPPYIIFSNFPWRLHVNDIFLGLSSRIPNYQVMNHTVLKVHHSFVSIEIEFF
jgi:hypothetical protein